MRACLTLKSKRTNGRWSMPCWSAQFVGSRSLKQAAAKVCIRWLGGLAAFPEWVLGTIGLFYGNEGAYAQEFYCACGIVAEVPPFADRRSIARSELRGQGVAMTGRRRRRQDGRRGRQGAGAAEATLAAAAAASDGLLDCGVPVARLGLAAKCTKDAVVHLRGTAIAAQAVDLQSFICRAITVLVPRESAANHTARGACRRCADRSRGGRLQHSLN